MRAADGEVLHFSHDPSITEFVPRGGSPIIPDTELVWGVDAARCPDYWFPRECPRAMAWVVPGTTDADRRLVLGPGPARRVHAVEYGWLDRIRHCQLYAYRLPAATFTATDAAHVSTRTVRPLAPPEPVGDLLALHAQAGIELRVLDNLWLWWDVVITTTVGFSGIRLRNSRPRP